jgi:hypothetical protein
MREINIPSTLSNGRIQSFPPKSMNASSISSSPITNSSPPRIVISSSPVRSTTPLHFNQSSEFDCYYSEYPEENEKPNRIHNHTVSPLAPAPLSNSSQLPLQPVQVLNSDLPKLPVVQPSRWAGDNFQWSTNLAKLNREVFGNISFRMNQKEVINAHLTGKDVLVLMPTGKFEKFVCSLCVCDICVF